jgi:amino acid adenylation domain-containing protein/non-ribosomal peptide synthase protein (TIGR01720 family)
MSVADRISALTPEQRVLFEKLREKQRRDASAPKAPPIPRVTGPTAEGDWPLSLDQERFWFMEQLYPGGAGLNLGGASRLRGLVPVPAIAAALATIVRRHAVLRTAFPLVDGAPVQRAAAPAEGFALPLVDLTALPSERREGEALRRVLADSATPFDLLRGPLLRASLLRLAPDEHVCVLIIHHLASDGLSFPILWGELATLCAASLGGAPAELPEPPVQYADFAVWQRDWLQGEVLDGLVSWWRGRLDDFPLVLELPLDGPRPAATGLRGGQIVESLPADLSDRLRALSRGEGATLFMTVLAAFAALLHRHSGQERLLVGANNANRNRPEIERLIGCFLTQVPFPIDLAGDPSFRELLGRVRQSALGVYAHQDLPFGKLIEAIQPERELNRQPIVQALVQVIDGKPAGGELPGLSLEPVPVFDGGARYDLMLTLFDRPEGLLGEFEYDADLFTAETARLLLDRLRRLLEAVASDPGVSLSEIPLLSAAERARLRRDEETPPLFPAAAHPFVHETFAERARLRPEALAVVCGDERLSYRELLERAGGLARRLRGLGVGPEARVVVWAERSAALPAAFLGILAAGGVYLPVDPGESPARVAFILADAEAAVLVTDSTLARRLPGEIPRVLLDEPIAPAPFPRGIGIAPESLAYVIYTSGSTGVPKGVGVSHAALAEHARTWGALHEVGPVDRYLQLQSASFDPAVEQIATALTAGAALAMRGAEMWAGEELAERLEALEPTVVDLPTSIWSRWVAGPAALPPSVRRMLLGGEELRAEHAREWRRKGLSRVPLLNGYGPTEAVVTATQHELGSQDGEEGRVPIGLPLPGRVARVLGRRGEEVPPNVPGELCLGGPLARGYLGRPALTAERFVPDPLADAPGERLYRSGDLVRRRPDGALEFLGRVDDQVKIRGFRVEPGEVAAALLAHPRVGEAEVVAREGRLVAYLVPTGPETAPTGEELRAFLRARLPEPMIPGAFVPLAALPLTAHGKVDRKALPAPAAPAEVAGEAPPRDAREERLAAIWREMLGLERLGVHDNFFQLGGDSILAIQVVARARREGIQVTARQLFEHQTVAGLAAAAGEAGAGPGEEQGLVAGEAPLTPIQRAFFAEARRQPWRYNQAVLLIPRRRLAAGDLKAALDRLAAHHDALRLRFLHEDGGRRQVHGPLEPVPLVEVDLTAAPAGALEATAERLQDGLDLARGPLFTAALFHLKGEDRLLLTVHHLVVDGVSWRVLLEDLAALLEGEDLPPKTTSWRRWAGLLEGFARSPEVVAELPWWLSLPAAPPLPRDLSGEGSDAQAAVTAELGRETTRALLQAVPEVYRTRVNDLLLAALARAFAAWTGQGFLQVWLEGHGREEIAAGVDLSRTVGWFTTLFPVTLALPPGGGEREAIRAVKETLRAVPGRGLGYGLLRWLADPESGARLAALPAPEVSFNYLGRLDAAAGEGDLLAFAPEAVRGAAGEAPAGRPLFAIDALVLDDRLRVSWSFDPAVHRRETAQGLADGFLAEIAALVEHCRSAEAGGLTPSDVPLARLGQEALDRLLGGERGVEDLYPPTPMQEGMLFHHLYAGAAEDLYFEQLTAEVEGDLDEAAFAAAWQRVAERHTALRTSFLWHGVERPLQAVRRAVEVPWTSEDWRGLPPPEVEERWRALLAADRARGFDLAAPPLLRLALARTGEATRRLVWSSHHILLDGWCFPLLLNEVFALYAAGGQAALPTVRPYRDYVAWLDRRDPAEAEGYWRRRLAGFAAPTSVPFDRPGSLGARGARPEDYFDREAVLPAPRVAALEALAQRLRVTLNTLVQGAWALLLSRYAQASDVVFGAVVSGRPAELPGVESMVGLFINTVPVRVEIPAGEPASAWLARLQADQLEQSRHDWTPLAEAQRLADLPAGEPLFASLLAFENYPFDPGIGGRLGGLQVRDMALVERTNYPLTLTAVARGDLSLRLTADRRFEPATALRLLGHLDRLLAGLAADPEAPPAALPLLSPAERHQLTAEWNDAPEAPLGSIPALVAAWVERTPDAVAVVCGDESLTYAALDRRAREVAGRLLSLGLPPEPRIALPAERSLELIPRLLGILQAGCAYLPVDPELPEERRRFLVEDSGAVWLEEEPAVGAAPLPGRPHRAAPTKDLSPGRLACVVYTSGSTGTPKGVAITHGNVARLVTGADYAPLGPGEVLLQAGNVAFDISAFEIWGPLANGGTVAVFPGRRPALDELSRAIARHGATTLWLTAGLFHPMVSERLEGLRPLKRLLAGGDVLAPAAVRRALEGLPDLTLIDGYGPTESTTFTTRHAMTAADLADERLADTVPIGRPLRGTTVHVLGADLAPVPVGVWGELFAGGDGVARGYLGRPGLTAERFVPDPFAAGGRLYRTGDLARRRPDGVLELSGRIDRQVKIRGFRVELGEIEAALARHPGVSAAAVVPWDVAGDRRLAAYVAGAVEEGELRRYLADRLPEPMIPAVFVVLDRLPLTPNGKVDRRALPAPDSAAASAREYLAPSNPVEESLAEVVAELLGLERVGMRDNFFALGGHSLLATRLVTRLWDRYGLEVPLETVFAAADLRDLADRLVGQGLDEEAGELSLEELRALLAEEDDGAA